MKHHGIDDAFKSLYPDVEWRNATAMRNFVIHEYFDVNYDEVWKTLQMDIPVLKKKVLTIKQELDQKNI